MSCAGPAVRLVSPAGPAEEAAREELLNRTFAALSDPVRRAVLERLGERPQLVSELAAPFDISLQAVSRHIQVLVRAGLVQQERTGRISRCRLDTAPIFSAAVWINRYSKYWQEQFDTLAGWLGALEPRRRSKKRSKQRTAKSKATERGSARSKRKSEHK